MYRYDALDKGFAIYDSLRDMNVRLGPVTQFARPTRLDTVNADGVWS